MNFGQAIDAFAHADALPRAEMAWMLANWADTGPRCRDLVEGYVSGVDLSERTERALFTVFHLLAEKADIAVFRPLCRLLHDIECADLLFGDDGLILSVPAILVSTFDGDPAPLLALVADEAVDDALRGELLMVLAYLARIRRFPEAEFYRILADLPDQLADPDTELLWFGWMRAVCAMGFAGLSAQAETLFQQGRVSPEFITPAEFWADLRAAREDPGGLTGEAWRGVGPVSDAIGLLEAWEADELEPPPLTPIRNPLRDIGRNDPCPCGSGRKYKKCCLAA